MRWKRGKPYLSWKSIDAIMLTSMVGCSLLVSASLITGICPLGCIFRTANRDKPKLSPRQVVLFGYARSGSSYLGQFVGGQEQVFYSYEPLDALYVSLYGTREGWNCHSDIVYFVNGSERIPSQREIDEVRRYMHNLLNCQTDAFYPEIWLHGFWQRYSQYHTSLRPYTACLWRHGVEPGDFLACQYHLLGKCTKRLNWAAIVSSRKCPVGILNKWTERTNVAYQQYAECTARLEQRVQPCRRYFKELCTRSRVRMAKTIRMTMEATEGLLKDNPDLRIIHLIRDPRAVVYSRSKFDPSTHGLYSGTPMDLVKEATAYCSIVRRDIAKRRQLEQFYPGSFMEVLYEEFVADPEALARRIYDFIGISFDAERKGWLRRTVLSRKGDPEQWNKSLPPHVIRSIDRVCEGLYEYIAYN